VFRSAQPFIQTESRIERPTRHLQGIPIDPLTPNAVTANSKLALSLNGYDNSHPFEKEKKGNARSWSVQTNL
jgi:hypothetical protein